MANDTEELTELTTNTKKTSKIVEVDDEKVSSETKSLKSSKQSSAKLKRKNSVPIAISSMRRTSSMYIDKLKEKEKDQCAQCLDSRFCFAIWIIISVFLVGVTFMTPISSIIAGWKLNDIFKGYSKDEINAQCNDEYNSFVYNGDILGEHAQAAFIWGIVDFVILLSQGGCIFAHFYNDRFDMDRNVFNIMFGVRLFFIVVWLVYASFFFDAAKNLDQYCDKDGSFYKDISAVFEWYIPILGLEVVKDLGLAFVACFGCTILCCIA